MKRILTAIIFIFLFVVFAKAIRVLVIADPQYAAKTPSGSRYYGESLFSRSSPLTMK